MKIFTKVRKNFNSSHYKYLGNFAFAQIFLVAISPFFARIYSPDDLGISSLFITSSLLLGSFSSLSFENSFFVEENENTIKCLMISFLICITLSFAIYLLPINFLFSEFFRLEGYPIFVNLLPIVTMQIGINNILKSFSIKQGSYKVLGLGKLIFSILVPSLTIFFGILNYTYKGLIFSFTLGIFITNIYFFASIIKFIKPNLITWNIKEIYLTIYKNRGFILWTMPSTFVNNLSSYLPVLFIGNLFGSVFLGQYQLALKAFSFPIGIFLSTIKDIFKEKVSNTIKQNQSTKIVVNLFFEILLKISLLVILPFALIFPYVFNFIFGAEWSEGGFLIHVLIPLLCINFISSPLSLILIIKEKQKLDFIWQIFFLIATTLSFVIPKLLIPDITINKILFIYSIASFFMYFIAIKLSLNISRIKDQINFKSQAQYNLCHLTLTSFENETRVLKQVLVQSKLHQIKETFIIAIYKDFFKESERLECGANLYRLKLWTKNLPNTLISQFIKYIEMIFRVINIINKKNIDIIVIHSLSLLPLAGVLKFFFNAKIIYDCHELETETYGLSPLRKAIGKLTEYFYIYYVDLILVVSPSIEKWYRKKYKLKNIITIINAPNYPIRENKDYLRRKFNLKKNKKIIIYVGAILEGRSVKEMIKLFSKLDNKDLCIVFLGYGDLVEYVKLAQKKYNNIFYHEAVPLQEMVKVISSADLGLAYIVNGSINDSYCLPNKFFEYIYSGIPVISSKSPDMVYYLKKYSIGLSINKLSYEELLPAIEEVLKIKKEVLMESIKDAKNAVTWNNEANKLIRAMEKYKII